MKSFLFVIVFLTWVLASLYFGIGGISRAKEDEVLEELEKNKTAYSADTMSVKFEGLTFVTKFDLKYYLEVQNQKKMFPWSMELSSFTSLIVTSMCFGLLGSMITIAKDLSESSDEQVLMSLKKLFFLPINGLLTGLIVFGLSYLLPTVLIEGDKSIRPITLMFLCLFGGIFSKEFHIKTKEYFQKIFK